MISTRSHDCSRSHTETQRRWSGMSNASLHVLATSNDDSQAMLVQSNRGQTKCASLSSPPLRWLCVVFAVGVSLVAIDMLYLQTFNHVKDKLKQSDQAMMILQGAPLTQNMTQHVQDLWLASQQNLQLPRGLVVPLYGDIAVFGKSLLLELRSLGVDLPVEIPHCGDLREIHQQLLRDDPLVRIYNVCEEAERIETSQGKLFCNNISHCHKRFRSFDIKPLAVVFSQFQEIMLLDADTIHFQSPMNLWETDKYKSTGTLFFHDLITWDWDFLALPMPGRKGITKYQHFMANFNVEPFRSLATLSRAKANATSDAGDNASPVTLPFEPSDFLLNSHSWNHRAGMEMESSVVLWNKARQPRATAILASFVSLNQAERPPSYGDKELFFIACELAETQYAFSDFGVGCVGWDLQTFHDKNTSHAEFVICGEILQFYPVRESCDGDDPSALEGVPQFTNGDNIFAWDPLETNLYRAKARSADFYAGSFSKRGIPQSCPFNITIIPLTQDEDIRIHERRMAVAALQNALH